MARSISHKVDTPLALVCYSDQNTAAAIQMKNQQPQGGSIIGVSSISAFFGGELQWSVDHFAVLLAFSHLISVIIHLQKPVYYP